MAVSTIDAIEPVACPVTVVPWQVVVTSVSAVTTDAPTLVEDGAVHPE